MTERGNLAMPFSKAQLKKLRRVVAYHVPLFEALETSIPPGIREELRHDLNDVLRAPRAVHEPGRSVL